MTLLWSTDPDRCPGELPWDPPAVDPDFPDSLILGGEEAIDQERVKNHFEICKLVKKFKKKKNSAKNLNFL